MDSWRPMLYKIDTRLTELGTDKDEPLPDDVKLWLTKLSLLDGVPLSYLVADERMLPMESIRFFYISPEWIEALTNGALSIGRMTLAQAQHDMAHLPQIYEEITQDVLIPRWQQMHKNHRRTAAPPICSSDTPQTGFLLRSELVTHWKGIEIKGADAQNTPVALARLEQLSDKILIGIFAGEVSTVEIFEPLEDLHFGACDTSRKIKVRYVDPDRMGKPTGSELNIPVDENKTGRIDILKLVSELETQLSTVCRADGSQAQTKVSSAELAVEMLSVAGRCIFRREQP